MWFRYYFSGILNSMTETATTNLALLSLLAPTAFALTALIALRHPGTNPLSVAKFGNIAGIAGMITAVAFGTVLLLTENMQSSTIAVDGLGLSIRIDSLSILMLIMVSILAWVIFRYSCTYMDGDPRHGAFLGYLAATIASVEILVLAGNLGVLFLAWVATSLSLHKLLVFYKDRPKALIAGQKKFMLARTGDAFLATAVLLLWREFSTGDLGTIFAAIKSEEIISPGWTLSVVDIAAICLVIAAVLKAAQFPTHGWLVEVMETPTPVSALLHAGILNAGPFLAIRMAYVLDGSRTATTALIIIGGFTAVFASITLLTQPSVKVMLGYSSVAHMGFMLMVCGLGLYPAALLHLVAHSFYKAHAFLSSGSVIDESRAHGVVLPMRLGSPTRILFSALIAISWYIPLAWIFSSTLETSTTAIAIGAIFVLGMTQLIAPTLDSLGSIKGTVQASFLALAVTTSFFSLETIFHKMLSELVPEGTSRDIFQWFFIATILIIFAFVVVTQILGANHNQSKKRRAIAIHFKNGLYANAYFDRFVGSLNLKTENTKKLEMSK